MEKRVVALDNPRAIGETLKGAKLGDYWEYRVGDYRIICDIQDHTLTILAVMVGNWREVYR